MARVARAHSSSTNSNTIVLKPVRLLFQKYPGLTGTDSARGISSAEYEVFVAGRKVAKKKTAADGSVDISLPPPIDKVVLKIFGTEYELKPVALDAITDGIATENLQGGDTLADLKPAKRRLDVLGYDVGSAASDAMDERTDKAIMDFLADEELDPLDGQLPSAATTKLKNQVGE